MVLCVFKGVDAVQQLEKKHQLAILVIISIILFGAGFKYAQIKSDRTVGGTGEQVVEKQPGQLAGKANEIVVHVTGAVSNPGLYRFSEGARVNDAVEKAKSLEEADLNAINLAELLVDSKPVKVPFKVDGQSVNLASNGPAATQVSHTGIGANASRSGPNQVAGGKVNLNTAGTAELDTLPGIGPTLAERIMQYRQSNGPFVTVEDLNNVSGIGEKKFADLKDLVTVN